MYGVLQEIKVKNVSKVQINYSPTSLLNEKQHQNLGLINNLVFFIVQTQIFREIVKDP